MRSNTTQYLFGAIFFAVAVYQFTVSDYLEFSLYALAGTTFVVTSLSLEPRLRPYKKLLGIASWILIIATGILFLYLLQFKFF